ARSSSRFCGSSLRSWFSRQSPEKFGFSPDAFGRSAERVCPRLAGDSAATMMAATIDRRTSITWILTQDVGMSALVACGYHGGPDWTTFARHHQWKRSEEHT